MDNNSFRQQLISRSLNLAKRGFVLADHLPKKQSSWVVADQLLRAITSIGANIVEAQAASSTKDFVRFLNYALKSANESKYWLTLCKEIDCQLSQEVADLLKETMELARILGASIKTLKSIKN